MPEMEMCAPVGGTEPLTSFGTASVRLLPVVDWVVVAAADAGSAAPLVGFVRSTGVSGVDPGATAGVALVAPAAAELLLPSKSVTLNLTRERE